MKYFKLPDLGEGLSEAEIVEWHVQVGDKVAVDQLLLSVETAKAIVEVPSPQAGEIAALFGVAGDVIHIGEPLVEFAGEQTDSGTVVGDLSAQHNGPLEDVFIIGAAPAQGQRVKATPSVRALAKRLSVDLNQVRGSGPQGQVLPEDVERASRLDAEKGAAEPLRGVRKFMAQTMAEAHRQVVPVTICDDVDIHAWLGKQDTTMRLIHAIAVACVAEPALNAWFDGENLSRRLLKTIDLGMAVDTEQGLFVPVLRNISQRPLEDLRAGLDRLRADVKNRTIPPQEMQGATITLSNFGTIAGRYASPVVVPPTVAIMGAGVVRDEVVAHGGQAVVHRVIPLNLTFDHRAITGGEAARFLRAMMQDLTLPEV